MDKTKLFNLEDLTKRVRAERLQMTPEQLVEELEAIEAYLLLSMKALAEIQRIANDALDEQ
jgi:hypothetical protein